jgi:hypothetical protein
VRCREARRLLLSEVENDLPVSSKELREHLADCRACSDLAWDIKETWCLLGHYPVIEPSADFKIRLRRRLLSVEPQSRRAWIWAPAFGWQLLALAACSLLIAVFIATRVATPPTQRTESSFNGTDRWDETFLDDLDQTLRHTDPDYLREYDSWPAGYLEGAVIPPQASPASKGQPSKGGPRHEGA